MFEWKCVLVFECLEVYVFWGFTFLIVNDGGAILDGLV